MKDKPKFGDHWDRCQSRYPDCPCNTCVKDNAGQSITPCCEKHDMFCASGKKCRDYVPEG